MLVFDLKVCYATGSSFGSYDTESILDFEFRKVETAHKNLLRIQSHYDILVKEYYNGGKIPDAIKKEEWFCNPTEKEIREGEEHFIPFHSIMLIDDEGRNFRYSTSEWVGYFEILHSVEVVVKGIDKK